mmetsp:Transcript_6239/g.9064  ORF Transcript_6239/g.9064 Transcript_6239/m.9064 type:complete len:107 (-) Transcript_6239:136-456(-)
MFFCPNCSNILLVGYSAESKTQWNCSTCTYVVNVNNPIQMKLGNKLKTAEPIISDWSSNSQVVSNIDCAKCHHSEAYFTEFQTRSADEPTTQFFKCKNCGNTWREG